ncbi:MAG: CHAT domain-containing protein [Rhizobiaceae bacterium]|nr:CHAT domain-containing protein [Rhizobiaceae bacterium]
MSRPAREHARRLPRRKLLAAAIVTALLVALVAILGPAMLHRSAEQTVARSEQNLRPTPIEPSLDRGPGAAEIALWNNATQADSEALLRQYLHEYPGGEFAPLAAAKLRGLETQNNPGYGEVAAAEPPDTGGAGGDVPAEEATEEPTDPVIAMPTPPSPVVEPPAAEPPPTIPVAPAARPTPSPEPAGSRPEPAVPAATVAIERFPTLDAPAQAAVGAEIEVLVALTEEQFTPDVTVRPGAETAVTAEGALAIANLPESEDGWLLHVDLVATGFEVVEGGKWVEEMRLNRHGDSDYVRYRLRALPISGEARPGRIQARFNLGGRYLGSVSRPITIVAAPAGAPAHAPASFAAASVPLAGPVALEGGEDEDYDLNIVVRYDDPVALGRAVVTFMSDHTAPSEEVIYTSPDLQNWLEGEYRRLSALGGLRGATSLAAPTRPQGSSREIVEAVASGLGRQLYDTQMPQRFKALFWHLKDQDKLRSIQITSNSSTIPWELVKPVRPDGSGTDEFLGVGYRLARWSLRDTPGQIDVPRERLPFSGIAAIAPPYEGGAFLPSQQREVDALSQIPGFRQLGGDFGAVRDMLSAGGESFIHFSGHGEISQPGAGLPTFSIRLSDVLLDPATWQAIALPGTGSNFYFFNACDTGRSDRIGGFVQGWGPALLQSGASGFIGGMWPLPDASAADFSAAFYATLSARLRDGPVHLADVLREVRGRFHETGDPTYLAYTYYGNANLRITPPAAPTGRVGLPASLGIFR